MKKIRIVILLSLLFGICNGSVPKKILLVGNSITHAGSNLGGIDGHILCLDSSSISPEYFKIDRSILGGATFKKHVETGNVFNMIDTGNYDLVILQGYSNSINAIDTLRKYVKILDSAVVASGAKTALYMTYARKSNPDDIVEISDMYYSVGKEINAGVIPAGIAMGKARNNNLGIDLFNDSVHFSKYGQYLISCIFYSWLTGKCPIGLSYEFTYMIYDWSFKDFTITFEEANYLQTVSWNTIQNDTLVDDSSGIEDSITISDSIVVKAILDSNSLNEITIRDVIDKSIGGRVVSLNLSELGIHFIPKDIEKLNELQMLNISDNRIEILPNEIGNLNKLTSLILNNNNLAFLSDSIVKIGSLRELRIKNNSLNELPESIGNLIKLSVLEISDNKIEKLPNSIGLLSSLEFLYMNNNNISNLPEGICNLQPSGTLTTDNNFLKEKNLSYKIIEWLDIYDASWKESQSETKKVNEFKIKSESSRIFTKFISPNTILFSSNEYLPDFKIEIFCSSGRKVWSRNYENSIKGKSCQWNYDSYSSGSYFVRLYTSMGLIQCSKFVILK